MAVINRKVSDTFNVGTGVETSVNQLFQNLLEITESDLKEIHGSEKKGEQKRSCLDAKKIYSNLEWEPRVSLKEGLKTTVDYFRSK